MVAVTHRSPTTQLVGRGPQMARLASRLARVRRGERSTILVAGEAGIGKTSLLRFAAADFAAQGGRVAWGTCVDGGAPGYWPWTQALDEVVREMGSGPAADVAGDDAPLLSAIIPSFGSSPPGVGSPRDRLLLMDAARRFVDRLARQAPVMVVIDDAHWADNSSLSLLDFVARDSRPGPVAVVAAYRHDELSAPAQSVIVELVSRAEHLELAGLDAEAVSAMITNLVGDPVDSETAAAIHRRSGGHPFFVRELAYLTGAGSGSQVPTAVRDAIGRRLDRLTSDTIAVLEVVALVGGWTSLDLVDEVLDRPRGRSEADAAPALRSGLLVGDGERVALAHDLLRDTIDGRIDSRRKTDLHRAVGRVLEGMHDRGVAVMPADVARHLVAAIDADSAHRALRWARAASSADVAAMAFSEAAGHLRRVRSALARAGIVIDDRQLADTLLAEADATARAGDTAAARDLLDQAWEIAGRSADPSASAQVALATAALGAQFATRRDELIRRLRAASVRVVGVSDLWEARLAATTARELQHSVAEDRAEAGPLSEHALTIGRRAGDAETVLTCLLARHDVLWTPGKGHDREKVAREIVAVAAALDDDERQAEGLILLANALLEQGSVAFVAALDGCFELLSRRDQPQNRYIAATRRACLALLHGDLERGEALVSEAAAIGAHIREPDTGNVRMSQRLELVRERSRPDELKRFAVEAVSHWTGAPVHAHAVAAGFMARAGQLELARQHVAAVADLGGWRGDRSYLWSVFVRELAHAAIALDDTDLASRLLADVLPLRDTCGVNGALVAFAGSHSHTAGLLAGALGDEAQARSLLAEAEHTYSRLGAPGWRAEVVGQAARGTGTPPRSRAVMRRQGPMWILAFAGRQATVPHSKGLADIARLIVSAGAEVHVLALMGSEDRSGTAGDVIDMKALASYRRRLGEIDADLSEAESDHDPERAALAAAERQAVLDEVGRVTATTGRARSFANHPGERARKAVSGRIRDAIRKLRAVLPEMADHLEQAVVTGTYCRYRPDGIDWDLG